MIHSNGGAIFHRREQDAAVKRFETDLQGLKGNRRFRRIGTETRELWATKVQGDRTRFRKRRATGVSGASETGSRDAGQPEFTANRNGDSGAAGNRGPRRTANETEAATGNRSCKRIDESRGHRATGVARERKRISGSNGRPKLPRNAGQPEFRERTRQLGISKGGMQARTGEW